MPEALSAAGDRAPDAWDPLVAIADVAGGAWPERARNAALALAGVGAAPVDGDIDTALLSDIKHILDACDALEPTAEQLRNNKQIAVEALDAFRRGEETATRKSRRIVGLGGEQLTNALATLVERKWPAWDKGKPMRPHQLARLLGAYRQITIAARRRHGVSRLSPETSLRTRSSAIFLTFPSFLKILSVTALRAQKNLGKSSFLKTLQTRLVTLRKMPEKPTNPGPVTL
jgi:hypothetical protein